MTDKKKETTRTSSPWIPAGVTIAAVIIAGALQFFGTAYSIREEAKEGRRIAQEERMSNLVAKYFSILSNKQYHGRLSEVRGLVAAGGSPELVKSFAQLECSNNTEVREAFREVIKVLRNQGQVPEVDDRHIDILINLNRTGGKPPDLCQEVFGTEDSNDD